MAESPAGPADDIEVTVRYFAAAQEAAGTAAETLTLPAGSTITELIGSLAARTEKLATVLHRCSYLCNGIAVRDNATTLAEGSTVEVLPPFSGG